MDRQDRLPVKSERAALTGFDFSGVSTYISQPPASLSSSSSTELTDLDLNAGANMPRDPPESNSAVDHTTYHLERIFLICHGCTVALVVRLPASCDLRALGTMVRVGHATAMLTTCRGCLRVRAKGPQHISLGSNELQELFSITRMSPGFVEQMHAYRVMKVVSELNVLILSQNGGLVYENWEDIVDKLPSGSAISMLQTDSSHGLIRSRLVSPFVPSSAM